ncbi:MAG: hypothetical protein MJZ70_04460 [Bacteroidales bacterium]|nr:hypothetical protein [Bacteroidales bacterium]
MIKANHKKILLTVMLTVFCLFVQAQNDISSPYSKYGYGLPSNITSGAYDAMGKVGYAMQNPHLINFKNPASYVAFDSLSFIADAAFSIYSSTLKTSDISQKSTYARPGYLTIGLPVTRHWRMSAGILPFSNLGYNIADTRVANDVTVNYSYQGDGGLMQLYWGNAFRICKGLSIGLNVSYLFGRLDYTKSAEFDGSNFFNTMVDNTTLVDGIYLSGGLQYFANIKNKHRLGFGIVYENSAYIWTKQTTFTYNYTGTGANISLNDTVHNMESPDHMQTPQSLGGGISYQYKDKWLVSADVTWQNWAHYYLNGQDNGNLQNAITVSAGLQFIPNSMSTNYLNKIRFRAGFRYTTGQIYISDRAIKDFSVAVGLGFPLKMYNNNPSLGFMFEYGQMGTLADGLLKENYFRFSVHFTLQEKWYQRVKLE